MTQLKANPHTHNFIQYFQECAELTAKNIRYLFGFNYRCAQLYGLKLGEIVSIESVMDGAVLKLLIARLRKEAKKIQEKEEVMLRKIDLGNLV